jgi:hypothetical protein
MVMAYNNYRVITIGIEEEKEEKEKEEQKE